MDRGQVVKAGMNNGDGNGKKRHKPAFGENTDWTGPLGRKSRAWESACTWGELAMTPAQQERRAEERPVGEGAWESFVIHPTSE